MFNFLKTLFSRSEYTNSPRFKQWEPVKKWLQNDIRFQESLHNRINGGCFYDSNALINKEYKFIPDNIGRDVWSNPMEFDARGGGDCEDFAIFKLWYLCWNNKTHPSDYDIVVGWLKDKRIYHCVLLEKSSGRYYDNQSDGLMLKGYYEHNFKPVYAINFVKGWKLF